MKTNYGFNRKTITKSIMGRLFVTVLAEEPITGEANAEPTPITGEGTSTTEPTKVVEPKFQVNFEDLVAKARKEEKDKLYPQIDTLKKENASLTDKLNGNLLTIEAKDKEISELNETIKKLQNESTNSNDEVVKTLKKEIKELKGTIEALEQQKVDITEVEDRIKGEYEVKLYREQKLREGGNAIIPELVTGMTKEDIDNSFELAKQRYNDIIKNVVSTATSQIPVTNANTQKLASKDLRPEDIANMTPQEWAEKRKLLGLR